jgi:hypothetical protein
MNDAEIERSVTNRRRALQLIGATALAPTVAGLAACATTPPRSGPTIDLSTPSARLNALMRVRGALDDRLVIGYVTGRYYGVVDGNPTPLFGVAAATFSRYRPLPGGGYEYASHEQACFTDLATGQRLEEWVNPLNGKLVKPAVVQSQPSWRIINPDLTFRGREPDPPGVTFDQRILPPEVQVGDVVFTEQGKFAGTAPGATRPFRYAEAVSMRARIVDLVGSNSPSVPNTSAYTSISSWRPWMQMGDAPGEMIGTGAGGYGVRIDEMPRIWLDAMKVVRPALIADPGATIAAIWNK